MFTVGYDEGVENLLELERSIAGAVKELGSAVLGKRLRRARMKEGLSIRELAKRAGVSTTSIVRMEQGQPFHGLTLVKICQGLGLHIERFLEASGGSEVMIHRHKDDRWYDMDRVADGPLKSDREKLAVTGEITPMLQFKSHLEDGHAFSSIIELYGPSTSRAHPGEEFIYVLEGKLDLQIGGKAHILEEGE